VDNHIKALLERKWSEIAPRDDPTSSRPGIVWLHRVSPPFPSHWPPALTSVLICYAFAEGHDLGGGLVDAVHISGPWARIEEPVQPASPPRLELIATAIASVGVQGVRPLKQKKLQAGLDVEPAAALLEIARVGMRDSEKMSALRKQYRGRCDGNAVFADQIRGRHQAFFDGVHGG
jgi:hypothetical protein